MSFRFAAIQFSKGAANELKARLEKREERRRMQTPRMKEVCASVTLSPEQEAAIDRLYLENYGQKIPYTWHKLYTAFTGNFDVNYLPELLYISEFERFENLWPFYCDALCDKNLLPILASAGEVRFPVTVVSRTRGMLRDGQFRPLDSAAACALLENAGELFCKPAVDSSSGRGCFAARLENGVDTLSGMTAEELVERLGSDFVIQKKLICHESIRKIYSGSVNTFRMVTYRWKDDILFFPTVMRMGRAGRCVDNGHAGGIFTAVEEDGRLHSQAFTDQCEKFDRHPDTGTVFEGYQIPLYPKVKAAARRMHELVPQLGVISWDFTLDQDGEPTLIEMNTAGGSLWLQEMAWGRSPFGDNTAEVLRWLRLMKNTKYADRVKYAFGKGV